MVSILAALVVGAHVQAQIPPHYDPPYFTEGELGKEGVEAFKNPDQVTVQRVFPAEFDQVSLTLGQHRLLVAGAEHKLPGELIANLTQAFSMRQPKNQSLCGFHPDHVIRYRKKTVALEILTCFTCHLMIIFMNGKQVAGGTLPWTIERESLDAHIPFVEQLRAAVDERTNWSGFYDALMGATGANAQAVELETPGPIIKWKELGKPIAMDAKSFEKLRSLIGSVAMMKSVPRKFDSSDSVVLKSEVLVTVSGRVAVQILFRQGEQASLAIRPDGKATGRLPTLIRDGIAPELNQLVQD